MPTTTTSPWKPVDSVSFQTGEGSLISEEKLPSSLKMASGQSSSLGMHAGKSVRTERRGSSPFDPQRHKHFPVLGPTRQEIEVYFKRNSDRQGLITLRKKLSPHSGNRKLSLDCPGKNTTSENPSISVNHTDNTFLTTLDGSNDILKSDNTHDSDAVGTGVPHSNVLTTESNLISHSTAVNHHLTTLASYASSWFQGRNKSLKGKHSHGYTKKMSHPIHFRSHDKTYVMKQPPHRKQLQQPAPKTLEPSTHGFHQRSHSPTFKRLVGVATKLQDTMGDPDFYRIPTDIIIHTPDNTNKPNDLLQDVTGLFSLHNQENIVDEEDDEASASDSDSSQLQISLPYVQTRIHTENSPTVKGSEFKHLSGRTRELSFHEAGKLKGGDVRHPSGRERELSFPEPGVVPQGQQSWSDSQNRETQNGQSFEGLATVQERNPKGDVIKDTLGVKRPISTKETQTQLHFFLPRLPSRPQNNASAVRAESVFSKHSMESGCPPLSVPTEHSRSRPSLSTEHSRSTPSLSIEHSRSTPSLSTEHDHSRSPETVGSKAPVGQPQAHASPQRHHSRTSSHRSHYQFVTMDGQSSPQPASYTSPMRTSRREKASKRILFEVYEPYLDGEHLKEKLDDFPTLISQGHD